jgi:hypothetical protein
MATTLLLDDEARWRCKLRHLLSGGVERWCAWRKEKSSATVECARCA